MCFFLIELAPKVYVKDNLKKSDKGVLNKKFTNKLRKPLQNYYGYGIINFVVIIP